MSDANDPGSGGEIGRGSDQNASGEAAVAADRPEAEVRGPLEPETPSLENVVFVLVGVFGTLVLIYGSLAL